MADIQININRYTELHSDIERARGKLQAAHPAITADVSGSLALPAFKQCVDDVVDLVDAYATRVQADSRMVYQVALEFMDQDDALAKAYVGKLGASINGE